MADKGIIFSAAMVRALLDGSKTQTRRLFNGGWGLKEPKNLRDHGVGDYSGRHNDPASWGYPFAEDGADMSLASWPQISGYERGQRLYVREACRALELDDGFDQVEYLADGEQIRIGDHPEHALRWLKLFHYGQKKGESPTGLRGKGVPSIHMPRWASRMRLAVTDVRVQRLQEISEEDAAAEGVCRSYPDAADRKWFIESHREHYGEEPGAADWEQFNAGVWVVPGTDCGFGPKPRQPLWGPTATNCYHSLWNSLHTAEGERWEDNPWIVAVSFSVHLGNIDEVRRGED